MTRKEKNIGFVNIVISIVLLLLSISIVIYPLFPDVKNIMQYVNVVSTIIVVLQIFVICMSYKYEKTVENEIFHMSKKQVYEIIKPYSRENTMQDAREELRFGLHILLFAVILVYGYMCIKFHCVLLFLAGTALILLVYIYADYIPHAMRYAKSYDKNYIDVKEKENSTRGLARIYLEEYQVTNFNRNHSFYKEVSLYDFEDDKIQDSCIKYILFMKADSIRIPDIVYGIFLMVINWILVAPDLLGYIIREFVSNINADMFIVKSMLSVIVNVIIAIINIIICATYKEKCEEIQTLSDVINDTRRGSRRRRFEQYEKCQKSERRSKFEAIRSRGVFVYCSAFIGKGKSLNDIPLKYRMLYIHKYYTNILRFRITVALLMFCMVTLLIEYSVPIQIIFFLILIAFFAALLVGKFVLPNLGKRRIAKKCRELLKN